MQLKITATGGQPSPARTVKVDGQIKLRKFLPWLIFQSGTWILYLIFDTMGKSRTEGVPSHCIWLYLIIMFYMEFYSVCPLNKRTGKIVNEWMEGEWNDTESHYWHHNGYFTSDLASLYDRTHTQYSDRWETNMSETFYFSDLCMCTIIYFLPWS